MYKMLLENMLATLRLESTQVFAVMETLYRKGVIDKFIPLFGEVLVGLGEETGMNLGDLLNKLNEVKPETIRMLDRLLGISGPLLRLANNDRLMGLVSRILDLELIRLVLIRGLSWLLGGLIWFQSEGLTPLTERFSNLAGGKAPALSEKEGWG